MIDPQIKPPDRHALADRVAESLNQFRKSLKQYRKAIGEPPTFILEKPAPALAASSLNNCKVFPDRRSLLESFLSGGIVAEVGTQYGYWASAILSKIAPKELHLFDLRFHLLRDDVKKDPRVRLHAGDSSRNLASCEDEYFDWIYIDGDHSYRGIKKDIQQAVKKVKPDGLLVFNDYTCWSPMEAIPYGTVTAVNELINSDGWEMVAIALTSHGYWDVALKRSAL